MALLEGIGRQVAEPDLLIKPLQNREALRSSALEGTYVTPEELLLYELDPKGVKTKSDTNKDSREVLNYTEALQHGLMSKLPLCNRLIKEMHLRLLQGVRGDEKRPGEWRRIQVYIGSNHRFIPAPLHEMERSLDAFEKYFHTEDPRFDPLVRCYLIHYQFETIHPFTDGNGRVGRLVLALMTHMWCNFTKPWLYMSEFFERHKDEYIRRLFDVSSRGDWRGWIEFCLQGTVTQAKDTIARCDKLRHLREEFIAKIQEMGGDVRLIRIMNHLFKSPIVRIPNIKTILGISYPTAKTDVERLKGIGILTELPDQPVKTFYCPQIIDIGYRD